MKEEPTSTAASPIINGNVDTTHQAVVAIILQSGNEGGLCSGTIVKTDPTSHIGWVLTAAHCVDDLPPYYVFQGNDFAAQSGVLRYEVLDFAADPGYEKTTVSSPHDFAVVRIIGVDATTPVIPIAGGTDTLGVGSDVESVGYGRTTLIATGADESNTKRHNVDQTIIEINTAQLAYNQAQNGICSGDSGGPVLVTIGGTQKVAGVHSYVSGDCNGNSVSGRVSLALSFINTQLAKTPPAEDCNLCAQIANDGNGTCAQLNAKCLADPECSAYYQCLAAKKKTQAQCLAAHPKAEGPFNAASQCSCNTACPDLCGNTPSCLKVPKCGFDVPAGDCKTCSESACCDETLACAADGTCYLCLKNGDASDPACATNAARKTMADCVTSKCATECAGTDLGNGGEPADAGDGSSGAVAPSGGGTTITTGGCSVSMPSPATSNASLLVFAAIVGVTLARRRRR